MTTTVYPRACGGTVSKATLVIQTSGPIPARAGEPSLPLPAFRAGRVYPRACGGTDDKGASLTWGWGLSPRVRGNPPAFSLDVGVNRSIPARAGEPVMSSHTVMPG